MPYSLRPQRQPYQKYYVASVYLHSDKEKEGNHTNYFEDLISFH